MHAADPEVDRDDGQPCESCLSVRDAAKHCQLLRHTKEVLQDGLFETTSAANML